MAHSTSVIVSTYDSPSNLEKVLWGFKKQCQPDFQLIVADDGSQHETRHMLENFKQTSGMNMEHLWHEKSGCQKSMMLNKAVQKASGDYLIFTRRRLHSAQGLCALPQQGGKTRALCNRWTHQSASMCQRPCL